MRSAGQMVLLASALLGCSSESGDPVRCAADGGGAPCPPGTECLWLHGGGSFCVATCASGLCTDGRSCQVGGASSCATCDDLIDVCE